MQHTYIGITLGPVGRIASYAQSTKGIWASSYLFSYIGEKITEKFYYEVAVAVADRRKFIKPYLEDAIFSTSSNGVGYFPDQYIFEAKDTDFDDLLVFCDDLFDEMGGQIAETLQYNTLKKDIVKHLKCTLKIYIVEKKLDDSEDIISIIDGYLNSMENRDQFQHIQGCNYLAEFFEKANGSFLTAHAFEKSTGRLFDSVLEYSAKDLLIRYGNDDAKKIDIIKKIEAGIQIDEMKPYHKYLAIVSADGDNIGSALRKLGKDSNVLSQALLEYNRKITQKISIYGGQAVFQGGDDLLFFAPIYVYDKSIFDLIKEIDIIFENVAFTLDLYNEELVNSNKEEIKFEPIPTLSFGVSISYFKHPMFEARDKSSDLLESAKNSGRNSIAIDICKHSGQTTAFILNKNSRTYESALTLISDGIKYGAKDNFLHSTTYWLMSHKNILKYILSNEDSVFMLENYFNHTFDESIHKKHKEYFKVLQNYLLGSYEENKRDIPKVIEDLHSILRFVELLNSKR